MCENVLHIFIWKWKRATHLIDTGRRRLIGSLIFIGRFPQKWPMLCGSFVENDLQLRGCYESWPPCRIERGGCIWNAIRVALHMYGDALHCIFMEIERRVVLHICGDALHCAFMETLKWRFTLTFMEIERRVALHICGDWETRCVAHLWRRVALHICGDWETRCIYGDCNTRMERRVALHKICNTCVERRVALHIYGDCNTYMEVRVALHI